jgi:hypothetical protein
VCPPCLFTPALRVHACSGVCLWCDLFLGRCWTAVSGVTTRRSECEMGDSHRRRQQQHCAYDRMAWGWHAAEARKNAGNVDERAATQQRIQLPISYWDETTHSYRLESWFDTQTALQREQTSRESPRFPAVFVSARIESLFLPVPFFSGVS